jgi:hypothetical protein
MIQSIELGSLRNAEYLQFQNDFIAIAIRNNPTLLQIEAKLNSLQQKSVELDLLFKKILANENTQLLVDIDTQRDQAILGITNVVFGFTYHYDEDIRTAAQKLKKHLDTYGSSIYRLNYQAETATLANIITDWDTKADLIDALNLLNLNDWKDYLKEANNKFNDIYLDRTQEYGNASPENLKEKRIETNVVYYALRDRINALHTIVETAPSPYQTLINQLNALIEQYNVLTISRKNSENSNDVEDIAE